jgi:hypothetical protein
MSTITAAATRIVGKDIGDCTAEDLDRLIAAVQTDMSAHQRDLSEARAERDRRNQL